MVGNGRSRRLVLHSIETEDGGRCVDIFEAPEGGFGFETFRRDREDGGGWYAIGGFDQIRYTTHAEAMAAAQANAPWIDWDAFRARSAPGAMKQNG